MSEINWEAVVRGIRTFVQGLIAAGAISAWDAIQSALSSGVGFDVRKLVILAVGAFVAGVVSYVMNALSPAATTKRAIQSGKE